MTNVLLLKLTDSKKKPNSYYCTKVYVKTLKIYAKQKLFLVNQSQSHHFGPKLTILRSFRLKESFVNEIRV